MYDSLAGGWCFHHGRRDAFVTGIIFVVAMCAGSFAEEPPPERPMNVVLIVVDDLGWKDLGCYGSTYYRTPEIDRLAAEGVRFTDAYAACHVCSPTRAAILTGKYPARLLLTQWLPAGRWDRKRHAMREGRYLGHLPLEEVTIAESLREAGYRTGFVGKWHLGTETYYYPEHQGFDVNVGGRDYGAPGSYFHPFRGTWEIPSTGRVLEKAPPLSGEPGDYLVDRLADEAVRFVREHDRDPFFLMLSHYAVHTPLQGKPEKVARYSAIAKEERQGKAAYAAMIESIDESVGRVLDSIEASGLSESTLVIVTSDNGGFARATDNRPLRANKGSSYEGGIRVPLIVRWPKSEASAGVCSVPVISTDLYPTILEAVGLPSRPHQHVDGRSLLPLLSGDDAIDREAIFWHYPHYNRHPESFPAGVVRAGPWKLIENYETGQRQLFHLTEDLGESHDRSSERPKQTERLQAMLEQWRRDVGADPMRPNHEHDVQ